jgi:hypothetical protein
LDPVVAVPHEGDEKVEEDDGVADAEKEEDEGDQGRDTGGGEGVVDGIVPVACVYIFVFVLVIDGGSGEKTSLQRRQEQEMESYIHSFTHTHTHLPTLQGTKEDHEGGMKGAKGRLNVGVECAW